MSFSRSAFLFAALAVLVGCDSPLPTEPVDLRAPAAIVDGAHSDGNQHFFFLPPLVPPPAYEGTFDGAQMPEVEICVWSTADSECGPVLEYYNVATGPGSETVRADLENEQYIVNWHTENILGTYPIDQSAGESYRIRILVGHQVLGYADVQVAENPKELKNISTGEYLPLKDGRTLPIKFRIEEGFEELLPQNVVSSADFHSCAVAPNGDAYCWGNNGAGQLGIGYPSQPKTTPQLVIGSHKFRSVTTAYRHTCGVTTEGKAYCWGANGHGEIGVEFSYREASPVPVSGDHTFLSVSAGGQFTCGLTVDGQVLCWGANATGQLGRGFRSSWPNPGIFEPAPVAGSNRFQSLGLIRGAHACAVTESGEGYCWGGNYLGQLGAGFVSRTFPHAVTVPTPVLPAWIDEGWTEINAGYDFTCGINGSGGAACWGHSAYGRLGNGSLSSRYNGVPWPQLVSGEALGIPLDLHFVDVVPGSEHACGVTLDGEGYCWGRNTSGELGMGGKTSRPMFGLPTPQLVLGGHTWAQIGPGKEHTCGLTTGGAAYCWGRDRYGRLGYETGSLEFEPRLTIDLGQG